MQQPEERSLAFTLGPDDDVDESELDKHVADFFKTEPIVFKPKKGSKLEEQLAKVVRK